MIKTARLTALLISFVAVLSAVPSAWGWGCEGHQVVALIAENHLSPRARAMTLKILADNPIDPSLSRYCKQPDLDAMADSSTWADDERVVQPDTGPWHYIDIPRGTRNKDIARFCPQAAGCIISALAQQVAVLQDSHSTPQARADALRYVIHFVGDIHQPLHAATNNDRGGNCVPVAFFDRAPHETNAQAESHTPNLHEVWDVEIIARSWANETPQQIAKDLDHVSPTKIRIWQSRPQSFSSWAWESYEIAERTSYGQLPAKITVEKPVPVETCTDDNHVSARMLQLDERLSDSYQSAAAPVVQAQLTKAGMRLAALLNSTWQ